jgi:hypothetical protein
MRSRNDLYNQAQVAQYCCQNEHTCTFDIQSEHIGSTEEKDKSHTIFCDSTHAVVSKCHNEVDNLKRYGAALKKYIFRLS